MKYDVYFEKAKDQGINELELLVNTDSKLNIAIFRGEIESFSSSTTKSLQARGKVGEKVGYVNSENFDKKNIDNIISQLKDNASINESKEECIIFKGSDKYTKKNVYSKALKDTPVDDKIALLKEIETKIKAKDSRIVDVELSYSEQDSESILKNSYGLDLKNHANYFIIYATVIASVGEETKTGGDFIVGQDIHGFDVDKYVDDVTSDALDQLGGAPCDSKKYKTVLSAGVMMSLTSFFVHSCSSEEVQKNTSLLKGKLHQKVASSKLTIEERPLDKGVFYRYFDDEGVATYNKKIVDKGVLNTYLYNLATAKKDGVESTGNGYRGAGKVGVSDVGLSIKPGKKTLDQLFEKVNNGIYITEVEGLHAGMNASSGNFSLQAKGYLIENGKRSTPVCLITVAGNLFTLFNDIQEVGSDVKLTFQGYSVPVIVKSLSVSGK
jgi:PmbA protein